ncbi:transporter substrate-binding domain-containing protein [Permianibacter sp. IMCC34836]|uniref:substrate-binding periplasmic protein n=1 Tax=Permianibacter fluminis TaxID=2738515 RepID=UPI001557B300|nr:transporter substrate-binding domain-containing protein [Permianibacter fluminis]NQD36814.1 transporter substrate-binding domain-containing protein [Permianibacter fluminis]
MRTLTQIGFACLSVIAAIAAISVASIVAHADTEAGSRAENAQKPVALVADDWCPQHCEFNPSHKGYIVEIVEQALTEEGVAFTITYAPWTRGLRMTEAGDFDGLLTPTVNGYEQFQFHQEPVGYQQYCFYVNADSPWRYTAPKDLLGKRLAHLKESGFGELETYLKANKDAIAIDEFPGNKDFTYSIFKFLAAGRADTIIMTSDVYDFGIRLGKIASTFKSAGCLSKQKLAVGLSKGNPERAKWLGQKLDSGIRKLRHSGKLKAILAEYGISP